MPTVPLSNGKVTLRQWREADASFYVRAIIDPEIQRWTTERPDLTEDAAREAILRHLVQPTNISLAITDRATGGLAGNIAMVSADWASGIAEVMYWLDAHWRGRGFSSAALRLVCDWTFRTLGLWRIELVMDPGNLPSRRTARAAGFWPDGTAPARKAGGPELVRYALVREPHQVVPVAHE
jgi:RimJ/RimL family protein N-acetyltransferase